MGIRRFNPHRPFRVGATNFSSCSSPLKTAFQSSPTLSGRCNASSWLSGKRGGRFQSSPTLSGRCNSVDKIIFSNSPSFNPHRPFRVGATVAIINHVLEGAGNGEIANLSPSARFEGARLAPEVGFSRCPREKSRFANLPGFSCLLEVRANQTIAKAKVVLFRKLTQDS